MSMSPPTASEAAMIETGEADETGLLELTTKVEDLLIGSTSPPPTPMETAPPTLKSVVSVAEAEKTFKIPPPHLKAPKSALQIRRMARKNASKPSNASKPACTTLALTSGTNSSSTQVLSSGIVVNLSPAPVRSRSHSLNSRPRHEHVSRSSLNSRSRHHSVPDYERDPRYVRSASHPARSQEPSHRYSSHASCSSRRKSVSREYSHKRPASPSRHDKTHQEPKRRKTDIYTTRGGRYICFICKRAGHIHNVCPDRP